MKTTSYLFALPISFFLPQPIQAKRTMFKRHGINSNRILFTIISIVGLLIPMIVPAQGTLYVSNLGEPPGGSVPVGSDSWYAGKFATGTNLAGYSLNSIQLLMDLAAGSPGGFTISLYSYEFNNTTTGQPGSNLGSLSGSDPSAGGLVNYTSSSITLSPSTYYFVVLTATTPIANGAYLWSSARTTSYSSSGDWFMASNVRWHSTDGTTWDLTRTTPVQFAVYASVVPEPSTLALAGLGLAALSFWRFRPSK